MQDFERMDVLGEGGYGKVFLVRRKNTNAQFALKRVKKRLLGKELRLKDAMNEKNIMLRSAHPFIVKLHCSFQDNKYLYYCMEYAEGGALFSYMRQQGRLSERTTRFYIAQVVLALQYLHEQCKCIYRDLKPENLLLDRTGYLKLTDFGLSTSEISSRGSDSNERVRNSRICCAGNTQRRGVFFPRGLLEPCKLNRDALSLKCYAAIRRFAQRGFSKNKMQHSKT